MIIRLILNGREELTGATAADIVAQMSLLPWPSEFKEPTAEAYMKAVASRASKQHKASVRVCCANHFLEDLISNKLVEVVQ